MKSCFFCSDEFPGHEELSRHQFTHHLERRLAEPHECCAICSSSPPMVPGASYTTNRLVEDPNFENWLLMRPIRHDGRGYRNDREAVWICPACTPAAFGAVRELASKMPKKPCAACGAPHGLRCTPSCDDDSVPLEKVKQWEPELYPDDVDLVAGDA